MSTSQFKLLPHTPNLHPVERAALMTIKISSSLKEIGELVDSLKVKSREVSGVGLFVNFHVPETLGKIEPKSGFLPTTNPDCVIESPSVNDIIQYSITTKNGHISMVEFVTSQSQWDGNLDGGKLSSN